MKLDLIPTPVDTQNENMLWTQENLRRIQDILNAAPVLTSPDGTHYKLVVDNAGNITTEVA